MKRRELAATHDRLVRPRGSLEGAIGQNNSDRVHLWIRLLDPAEVLLDDFPARSLSGPDRFSQLQGTHPPQLDASLGGRARDAHWGNPPLTLVPIPRRRGNKGRSISDIGWPPRSVWIALRPGPALQSNTRRIEDIPKPERSIRNTCGSSSSSG
jgi:hypothetical protein